MILGHWFSCALIIAFAACNTESGKTEVTQSEPISAVQRDIDKVDRDFNLFVEKFSEDSAFQLDRTSFPLRIKQYDIDNDKDTILYRQRSAFEMMDFRKKKSDGRYDQWKQEIVMDKNQTKARIEIRGIENGIMVDYYFEKKDGKWMLVNIDDAST
jgi:hypothetical protein